MSLFKNLQLFKKKTQTQTLTTTLGFISSSGPYYTIRNAKLISTDFNYIQFTIRDENTNEIKYTSKMECNKFNLNDNTYQFTTKADYNKYPYMNFYINKNLLYQQPHHIIIDVDVVIPKTSNKQITDVLELQDNLTHE